MASTQTLPYWLVNLPLAEFDPSTPPSAWPACPPYLQSQPERVQHQLATRDQDYHLLSWPETKSIIRDNRLELLSRIPSQLRRYLYFVHRLKQTWGGVMDFVLRRRVEWEDLAPRGKGMFDSAAPGDVRVLYNDWPYGLDTRIVHLVVWVKFAFEDDPDTGDLTGACRAKIQAYVESTFCGVGGLKQEDVTWFRNWSALKSVHSIEHFHVLLHDPDPEFLDKVTGNDRPMHSLTEAELERVLDREGSGDR